MKSARILRCGLAALALMFAAVSCGEPENPENPTPDKPTPDKPDPTPVVPAPMQILVVKHSNATFAVPSFSGSIKNAKVQWGDGIEEDYAASLSHTYSSGGAHTVTFTLDGASAAEFPSLEGLTEIDVTGFN